MHPYATDSRERINITAVLAVLSLLIGRTIDPLFSTFPDWVGYVVDFSPAGLFIFFIWISDRYLWRWKFLRMPLLFQLPDLTGRWMGELYSSHTDFGVPMMCELRVKQTWTRLCIELEVQGVDRRSSKSESVAASLLLDLGSNAVLRYEYVNTPEVDFRGVLNPHGGTTKVVICDEPEGIVLEGTYYTDRDPPTRGRFRLTQ